MQAEGSPHYRPILVNISVIGIHKGKEGQGILHSMLQFVLPRQMQPGYCREIVAHSDGRYYPIADLTPHSVHNIVSMERSSLLPRDESARGTGLTRLLDFSRDYLNVCKTYMKSTHPAFI